MNDAENKNRNPQKSRTCTLSQNLLPGVKPVSLCEANEQASFFKAALMHESELVNCETTPSESGLEQTAETGTPHAHTHTRTHTLIGILFETIFCGAPKGGGGSGAGARREATCIRQRHHAPAQTGDGHNCWSSFSLTIIYSSIYLDFVTFLFYFLWVSTCDGMGWGNQLGSRKATTDGWMDWWSTRKEQLVTVTQAAGPLIV